MVKHWHHELAKPDTDTAGRHRIRRSQVINATGAVTTAVVFVIVLLTKFLDGAYPRTPRLTRELNHTSDRL